MPRTVQELTYRLVADEKALVSGLKKAQDRTKAFGQQMERTGKLLSTRLTLPIVGVGAAMVKLAADAEETGSKFDTVFKDQSAVVREWADEFAESVGRSATEQLGFLSTIQDTLVPLGFARDRATEMSKATVQLSTDLASFNNLPTEQVIRDVQSALVGNTETLRKYGVVASQEAIVQEALNSGLIETASELDATTKAQAIYNLTVQGTTDAQGDAIRTAGSATNQLRALKSETTELAIEFGELLLPAITDAVGTLRGAVEALSEMDDETKNTIVRVAGFLAVLGPVAIVGGKTVAAISSITAAVTALKVASFAAAGPVAIGAAGVGGLVAMFALLSKNMRDAEQQAADTRDAMAEWRGETGLNELQIQAFIRRLQENNNAINTSSGAFRDASEQFSRGAQSIAQASQLSAMDTGDFRQQVTDLAADVAQSGQGLDTFETRLREIAEAFGISQEQADRLVRLSLNQYGDLLPDIDSETESFTQRLERLAREFDITAVQAAELIANEDDLVVNGIKLSTLTGELSEELVRQAEAYIEANTAADDYGQTQQNNVSQVAQARIDALERTQEVERQTALQLETGLINREEAQNQINSALREEAQALLDVGYRIDQNSLGANRLREIMEQLGDAEAGRAIEALRTEEEIQQAREETARRLLRQSLSLTDDAREQARIQLEILRRQKQEELAVEDLTEEERRNIIQFYANEELRIKQATDEAIRQSEREKTEALKTEAKKQFDDAIATYNQLASTISTIGAQIFTNQQSTLDKEFEYRKQIINDNVKDEDERGEKIKALEKERAIETAKIKRKEALFNKVTQAAQAAVDTAAAVAKALPNIPLSVTVGALGAAQTALILAQPLPPIPSFAQGGSFTVPPGYADDSYPLPAAMAQSGERVTVETREQQALSDGGGDQRMTVQVIMDGRQVAERTVDYINNGQVRLEVAG